MYTKKTYRNQVRKNNLVSFHVVVKETDLFVQAEKVLENRTRDLVLRYRGYIENYIKRYPEFAETLVPWLITSPAPDIIRKMADASKIAGVGPMAAVAGAIAEQVGMDLLKRTGEVIVENGGDVFLKTDDSVTIGIFAGKSPLCLHIGLRLPPLKRPISVCTSSGTVGHSLSLGKADAVCVVSESCCLADAAATSIGNRVKSKRDIHGAIEFGKRIEGLDGIVIIVDEDLGAWGELELVPIYGKNG